MAKLSFIDLAGSEGAWDTAGRGEGLWEGTSINRSLLALRSVVRALAGAKVRLLPAGPRRALALRGPELSGASVSRDRAGRATCRSGTAN